MSSTGKGVKYMQIRHHCVRQYIEHGVLMIKFVRSKDNTSDICTKNMSGNLLQKHSEDF